MMLVDMVAIILPCAGSKTVMHSRDGSNVNHGDTFVYISTGTQVRIAAAGLYYDVCFFFSSRRRHTRFKCDWSSDVCSSDLFEPRPSLEHPGWARHDGEDLRLQRRPGDDPGDRWPGTVFVLQLPASRRTHRDGARSWRKHQHVLVERSVGVSAGRDDLARRCGYDKCQQRASAHRAEPADIDRRQVDPAVRPALPASSQLHRSWTAAPGGARTRTRVDMGLSPAAPPPWAFSFPPRRDRLPPAP